ncbi:ABC transporter permease [Panacibacter sp. DH6]|uniref:ABC transporter permease n=1 Tax=Panacibacter microcysteis TaxID=2793269 RepID=A0A931GWF0_9BACT|nr:ABC transporter permease [Panacibacter microcysteis]MBG9377560.1 ABC transporter permease [Panacibacter microcysteis]
MFRNYFKTAVRNLWRNRQFSIINVAGLTLGLAVFLFIMQYVAAEWSANRYNKNYDVLYRVNYHHKAGPVDYYNAPGLAPLAKRQIPEIDNYVRIADGIAAGVVTYTAQDNKDNKVFREPNMMYVDGSFLDVFSFPLIAGSTSLWEPNSIALSEEMNSKLFGTTRSIGKTVTISNQFGNTLYTVKAVYSNPQESDIKSEALLSLQTLESAANRDGNDWADPNGVQSSFTNIYIKLKSGADPAKVERSITAFVNSADAQTKGDDIVLQPFSALHLAPSLDYPYQTFGNLLMVLVFAGVSLLILVIAWVNYINLSTAQALNRAKEVGVRKVLGASRKQLVFQYLAETFILTLISAVIAICLVSIFQQPYNDFVGKSLSLSVLNNTWFWLGGIALIVAGTLLAGSYVAFTLTSYKPINTIRGKVEKVNNGLSLRKGLVIFQFTVSIIFIISTAILYKQLRYMQTEKLGMNLDQLLVIQGPTVSSEDQAEKNVSFKNALSQLSFVKKQSASNNVPGIGYNFSTEGITRLNNPQKDDEKKSYSMFICDQNFFDTWGIGFLQGRTFKKEEAERSWNNVKSVIINEKAAQQFGFDTKQNIIGQKINWGEPYEIVGVVKDYHHLSLREPIRPTIYLGSVSYSFFTVQTDERNMQSKIETIKQLYNSTFPGNPFEYFFADDKYDQQYFAEQKLGNVFITAAVIAIFIACLGLFGLAAFSARQRVKEIGIRKVLGASVTNIAALLSKDFIKLVMVAIIVASPLAWWAMSKWLQDFAYRTAIDWWIFLVAGIIAIAIALLTVSLQAVKAAMSNPIKNLRTE